MAYYMQVHRLSYDQICRGNGGNNLFGLMVLASLAFLFGGVAVVWLAVVRLPRGRRGWSLGAGIVEIGLAPFLFVYNFLLVFGVTFGCGG